MIRQLSQNQPIFVSSYSAVSAFAGDRSVGKSSRVDDVGRPTQRSGAINPGIR
jgi:hypothetical protein